MLNIGCSCLGLGFIFFILLFLIKFWVIIFLFFLIILLSRKELSKILNINLSSKKEAYTNKPGEIYKVCPFCDKKADRKSKFCDNCKKPFE